MGDPIANSQEIRHHAAPEKTRSPNKSRLKQSPNKPNIELGKAYSDLG